MQSTLSADERASHDCEACVMMTIYRNEIKSFLEAEDDSISE